jgi:hypothetical protein
MITPTAGAGREAAPSALALVTALAARVAGSRVSRAAFVAVVLVLTVGSVLFSRVHHDVLPSLALALSVLGTAALILVLRWPFPAITILVAAYQVEDVSPAAGHAFDEIAAQARIALDELRSVLGVLRAPDGAAPPLGPQPRLADLPELVDRMRAGGLSVAVRTLGTPRLMTDATELCCYRVVQEALTNVMRHEPKATAQVDLAYDLDVTITVTNSVRLRSSGVDRPAAGFGLTGMRERVLAVGGELRAGVRDGHFRVHLRIPTDSCTGEWP